MSLPCITSTSISFEIKVQQIPVTLSPHCVTSTAAILNCFEATLNSPQTEMPSTPVIKPLLLVPSKTANSAQIKEQTWPKTLSQPFATFPNFLPIEVPPKPLILSQALLLPVAATDDLANSHHTEARAKPSTLL